jgi:NAD(P)-dependent dehydrogenase (short-subunit alcohol dehydrogenase family)
MSTSKAKPVAIVTGAGRGIGRATAVELSRVGYDLVITARTAADVDSVAHDIGALAVPGDVTDPTHAQKLIGAALEHFGRVDALVNNAGYAPVLSMDQATADEWHRIIDTNLTAPFLLTKAIWPIFKRQKSGVIVNLSSAASRDPFPGLGLYGSAKAAINVMSLALAREGDAHGIRVHVVAPSATETDMFRGIMSKEQVPTERIMQPADVAKVIAGCVTGELAYTSGEVIYLHKTPA